MTALLGNIYFVSLEVLRKQNRCFSREQSLNVYYLCFVICIVDIWGTECDSVTSLMSNGLHYNLLNTN